MTRFWTATTQSGQPYYGLTSNGSFPAQVFITSFESLNFIYEVITPMFVALYDLCTEMCRDFG